MMSFWISLFAIGFLLASAAYLYALRKQLMAVVDLVWTVGLGAASVTYFIASGVDTPRAYVVSLLVLIWSLRLSVHLFRDRVINNEEDPRYANLAGFWGRSAKRNFYLLFLVQVVFVALFLLPVTIAMSAPSPAWFWTDWVAVAIALIAFSGETIADRQLAAFRANSQNQGMVCRRGLWRYSRHPNYFFEWLHWWAYVAFAWSSSSLWVALVGPAAMYLFLRYLTGIPHAERSSLKRRGEAYRQYQQSTSAFFPWIPREPQV